MLTGAEPPPVGGPPALLRMPTPSPSVAPANPGEPAASAKPAHVVGLGPPWNVGLPLMFGELAPDHMLFVLAVSDPASALGPGWSTLFTYVSPLGARSPDLLLFMNSLVLVHRCRFGRFAQ